jgi:hypothetical protein
VISSMRDLVNAENDGKTNFATWRKTVSQSTTSGVWFDMSMSPGNPVPNYYAASPLVAVAMAQSTDGGISHGQNVAQLGYKKFLKTLMVLATAANAAPLPMLLCDYLMYYPFVDMGNTDPQTMTNTVTLPRYTNGVGVQIMAVEVAAQSGSGNPQFFVTYTNSDGVSGRTTQIVACNTATATGSIITAAPATRFSSGPFLGLQAGDKGVRSIESVQFLTADIGLIAMVLVVPIENISFRSIDAPAERVPVTDFFDMPQIQDDAYLNLLCNPQSGLSTVAFHGYLQAVWG